MATAANNISQADFAKLVGQAKLSLKNQEKEEIRSQLNEALDAIAVFDELDIEGVKALNQPIEDAHNVWREDVVKPSFSQEEALSEASSTLDGYFMVDAIFEEEDN